MMPNTDLAPFTGAGLALVPIPPSNGKPTKAPRAKGWNLPRAADNPHGYSSNLDDFINATGFNFGLYHGASNTLALDLDDVTLARKVFDELTDLQLLGWLESEHRAEVKSPKANRGKLLFTLPAGFAGVQLRQLKHGNKTIFELRCGNCQDVIIGEHPEGGNYQFIGDPARIPEAPAVLLDMLRHWDDWKPCFDSALGIEQEPPRIAPQRPQQCEQLLGSRDPIREFNQSYSVADILTRNGYKTKGRDRFIRPGSESKAPGAVIMRNCADGIERIYSHGGDVLNDGFAHDAFDCYRLLECGGDWTLALNWNPEITKHNQRLYTHESTQNANNDRTEQLENIDIDGFFDDLALTDALVDEMADAKFLIPNVIVKGHLMIFAAPANGGKSALFRYFCEQLSNEFSVLYINVDAGADDLKKHHIHAKKHGYKVVAPDAHVGKSVADVVGKLNILANSDKDLSSHVFILDTLKKFVDVISKANAKDFYKLLRKLTVKGATVCCLSHTNKYKDTEGNLIFEGTVDLRNDCDDLIYFENSLSECENVLKVTTNPDKVRAAFKPVSFEIDRKNGLTVKPLDKIVPIVPDDDAIIISQATAALVEGCTLQGEIVEFIKNRSEFGDKKIKNRLKKYSTPPGNIFNAKKSGQGKGVIYELV